MDTHSSYTQKAYASVVRTFSPDKRFGLKIRTTDPPASFAAHLPLLLMSLIFIFVFATAAHAQALDSIGDQPKRAAIMLLVQTDKDSVTLRWMPSTPGAWQYANEYGYVVERVSIGSDSSFDAKGFRALTSKPLRPWTKEEWAARVNGLQTRRNSTWLVAAQNLLYYTSSRKPGPDNSIANDFNEIRDAADEFANRFSFALLAANNDALAADGLALRFVDHDVSLGKQYVYRVYVAKAGDNILDTAYQVVDVVAHTLSPAPSGLEVEVGDGKLRLHHPESDALSFSGYYIDRSDDGGKTYRRLNETPHITIQPKNVQPSRPESQYTDTSVINYRKYRYKVRGITPFAELSEPAEIEAMARDLTPPPAPRLVTAEPVGAHRIRIRWEMKDAPLDFASFMIFRSILSTSGFEALTKLTTSSKEFIDTSTAKEVLYYYIITASDTAGNSSESLPASALIMDSLPPLPPLGLKGTIDTNGIVRLQWLGSPEYNILGYRVLWSNDPKHEFAQRTPIVWSDTTFLDTITVKTLTPYIYYRIAAVNKRRMHSDPSAILALKRPDRIAPTQPVFTNVVVTDSSVELHWARSRSEDLASQIIERRKQTDGDQWKMLESIGREIERYDDKNVEQNVTYEYRITSIDSSGLHSLPCTFVQGRPYDPGIRQAVRDLRVSYDSVSKSAVLHWEYTPTRKEDYWFVVYRGAGESGLAQYRAIKSEPMEFRDSDLPLKPPYQYAIRVITKNGAESVLSNVVTVNR